MSEIKLTGDTLEQAYPEPEDKAPLWLKVVGVLTVAGSAAVIGALIWASLLAQGKI